uniref:Uncharacterized protein n=1 Tax=Octopus bimaculoides TaxID=37653 RepID=A0A0L8FPP1_OCTBM
MKTAVSALEVSLGGVLFDSNLDDDFKGFTLADIGEIFRGNDEDVLGGYYCPWLADVPTKNVHF